MDLETVERLVNWSVAVVVFIISLNIRQLNWRLKRLQASEQTARADLSFEVQVSARWHDRAGGLLLETQVHVKRH